MNLTLKFKKTPEQVELIKAAGSKNKEVSLKAQEILAAFVGAPILQIIEQVGTASLIYSNLEYDDSTSPSYPLDLYYDENEDFVTVWSQNQAGGLPSSTLEGVEEMKLSTYNIQSAANVSKKYARNANLDVVGKALRKMSQEMLIKQERNAWFTIMQALGEATTNGADHLITSNAESVFVLDDISALIELFENINKSFASGTSAAYLNAGLTDLIVSSSIMKAVRGFVYNPLNVLNPAGTAATATHTGIPLPDEERSKIFNNVGASELFGISLHRMGEFGISGTYNTIFTTYCPAGITHGGGNFVTGDDEIVVGLDLTSEAFVRPIAVNAETNTSLEVSVDDQWPMRADRMGWYTGLEEGRTCIDARKVVGLIV